MKVLFVLEHYYPYIGGAEMLFQLLAESLAAKSYEVTVLTTRFKNTLVKEEIYNGVNIVRLNLPNRFLFTFLSLPKIIHYAKEADLIHTTTYNAAFPAWFAAKLTSRKIIVTFHEVWSKLWFRLPFASKLEKYLFYSFEQLLLKLPFDHYIAVSKFTQEALIKEGIRKERISQIYNGLYYDQFRGYKHQPPKQFTYTYFGRLGISKGLDFLLPAAKRFSETYPNSRLILILPKRPAKMYQQVLRIIETSDLTSYIQLRHELSREELFEQICHSSCVVIPSHSEGFCFVAAETVALRVPIISSGQGALKEVVSGKFLEMDKLNEQSLFDCLCLAFQGDWQTKPPLQYTMSTALSQYIKLYEQKLKTHNKI